ncbi:response regulator [Pedobacter faecalis]|uniref:response regulator n=1 Tax=Pedobacter faecalis TaxID=3041495 RepID=UPI00254F1DA4|nr:response regulator transcription factor [Pedobacter sp. ELA7]
MIRIIIADDHDLVRNILADFCESYPDLCIVRKAANGFEVLEMLAAGVEADVIVTDYQMPGLDGIALTAKLAESYPEIPVIVFTMFPGRGFSEKARQAGAKGFVNKGEEPEELIKAIRLVAGGSEYFSDTWLF